MNKKGAAVIAIVLFVIIGCFFLPSTVAGIMDRQSLGKLIITDSSSISYEATPDLPLTSQLRLMANTNAESAQLKTGKNMDSEAAFRKVMTELRWFDKGGELGFDYASCSATEIQAGFVIHTEDPSINMIIWLFQLVDAEGNTLAVVIDDETGLIMHMFYRRGVTKAEPRLAEGYGDAELEKFAYRLAELMNDYYGYDVSIKEYAFIGSLGYYNAELRSGETVIPLYGIVQESGFSINE